MKTRRKTTIKYELSDDDTIQLDQSFQETQLEEDESDYEYVPVTKKKRQRSSTEAVEIVPKKKRSYDTNKKWPCKKCGQDFPTKRTLVAHRKEEHATVDFDEHTYKFDEIQELYVCNTCSAEYQEQMEIEKHIKTHEENFQCTVCKEKFKKAYDFGTHSAIHSEDKLFRCPLCTYKTLKRTGLLIHINYVHLKKFTYICETCGKGFNDTVLYKEHNNEHLGIRPFACIVCTKTFTYSRYLLTHQIRSHRVGIDGQLLPNQCVVCNKVFSKFATLEKHYREKHVKNPLPHEKKHLCDTCGKGFSQKNKLRIHYRVHTGFKPYTCTYCAKSFTKKDYLVMHERVHSGEKPYSCEYCGKCFSQGAPLRIHLRTHTGERPYVCQFCTTGFTSRGALNMHCKNCSGSLVNTFGNINLTNNAKTISVADPGHHNPRTLYLLTYSNGVTMNCVLQPSILLNPAPMINYNFAYPSKSNVAIQQHSITMPSSNEVILQESLQNQPPSVGCTNDINSTTPQIPASSIVTDPLAIPTKEKSSGKPIFSAKKVVYKNPFDYSEYAKSSKISKMVKRQFYPERDEHYTPPPKEYVTWNCLICSKTEKDKDSLIDHYEYHKRENEKNDTDLEETNSVKPKQHKSIQKLDSNLSTQTVTKYECQTCNVTFATEKAMSRHICSQEVLECLCSACGKKFKNKSTLKIHMRIHNGVWGYVCNVCGKTFRVSSTFNEHLRVHSGEKPYKCNTCGKCFSQRSSQVIHQRGHTGERPYVCGKCGKGYASRSALNLHTRNCHK